MSLQVGQQLGSYEITSLLGKGGMGEVYRARDFNLTKARRSHQGAPGRVSRDDARVIRFQCEAQVLVSLNRSATFLLSTIFTKLYRHHERCSQTARKIASLQS